MIERQKKVLSVLALGVALLVWRGYVLVVDSMPAAAEGGQSMTLESGDPPDGRDAGRPLVDPDAALWEAQRRLAERPWGRDPFEGSEIAPVASDVAPTTAPPAPTFRFTGAAATDGAWRGIVDGKIVRVGDVLNGEFRVEAIGRDSMTVAARGWLFEVGLGSETVKAAPRTGVPK